MLSVRAGRILLLIAALAVTPAIASRTHRPPTPGHKMVSSRRSKRSRASKIRGQRAIDSERATQIQTALIGQKYLTGSPTGQWDAQTQVAMQRYQADHGWQTKLMPDSRALISLGLGPAAHGTDVAAAGPAQPSAASPAQLPQPAAESSAEPGANTLASVHSISQ